MQDFFRCQDGHEARADAVATKCYKKTRRGHALLGAHPGRRKLPWDRPWNEGHQKGRKEHDADPGPVPAGKYRTLILIPFEIK